MADIVVLAGTIVINENKNETPSTCTFQVTSEDGSATVAIGDEVAIRSGDNSEELHFAGLVTRVEHIKAVDDVQRFNVTAVDYSWLMQHVTVYKRFTGTTSAAVLAYLIGQVSGLSLGSITLPNDSIEEITFTNETVSSAVSKIVGRFNGTWKVDYTRVFSAFMTSGSAENVTLSHETMKDFAKTEAAQQHANRVEVTGIGTTVIYSNDDGEFHDATVPIVANEPFVTDGDLGVEMIIAGYHRDTTGVSSTEPPLPGNSIPFVSNQIPGNSTDDPFVEGSLESGTYGFVVSATTDLGETHYVAVTAFPIEPSEAPCGLRVTWLFTPSLGEKPNGTYGTYNDLNVYISKDGGPLLSVGNFSAASFQDDMPVGSVSFDVSSMPNDDAGTAPDPAEDSTAKFFWISSALGSEPGGLHAGDSVNILVTVEDTVAQAAFAALFSHSFAVSGVVTKAISDNTLRRAECQMRAQAELDRSSDVIQRSLRWDSYDQTAHPGATVMLNYPNFGSFGPFMIQRVTINFERATDWDTGTLAPIVKPPRVSVEEATPVNSSPNFQFSDFFRPVVKSTYTNYRTPQLAFAMKTPEAHTAAPTVAAGWARNDTPGLDDYYFYDVVWAEELGIFCAVGVDFNLSQFGSAISSDGITWTPASTPGSVVGGFEVVWAAGLGLFVAVDGATPWTSPDGETWTQGSFPGGAPSVKALAWGESVGLLVAPTFGSSRSTITSADGFTWAVHTNVLPSPNNIYSEAIFANGQYMVFSYGGITPNIATSPDGLVWVQQSTPATDYQFRGPAVNAQGRVADYATGLGMWAAAGLSSSTYNAIHSEDEGVSWTVNNPPDPPYITPGGIVVAMLAAGNSLYANEGNIIDTIWYTTDGITWTAETLYDDAPGLYWGAHAYSPSLNRAVYFEANNGPRVLYGIHG